MRAQRKIQSKAQQVQKKNLKLARTENGELCLDKENFASGDPEDSLMAMNFQLVTKDDFPKIVPYFNNILKNGTVQQKVLAITLLFHFRDLEEGKGLRNPLIQSLLYIYQEYPGFVHSCVKYIPKYGYWKDLCRLFTESTEQKFNELANEIQQVYANQLKKEHDGEKIVNCAKFAPRENKKYKDFAWSLSKYMFPESKVPQKDYRVYLQEIYSRYEQITERLMCQNRWEEINPKFVPSICFKRYKKAFLDPKEEKKEDEKRKRVKQIFTEHIEKAVKGETKVNAKRLFVNELIEESYKYINFSVENEEQTEEERIMKLSIEAQLMDIIEDTKKGGKLFNENIAIMCDVSGSMSGIPMNVCIGLGLIISTLNTHPEFGNRIMTFESHPQWVCLKDQKTLLDKIKTIQGAPWGGSTNFIEAIKLLVNTAEKEQDIPKILFVLSDMQFDHAGGDSTMYKKMKQLFQNRGYSESSMPVIVFWNLRGTENFVVDSSHKGVICIGGYSQNLLKSIMRVDSVEKIKLMNPFTFVKEILEGKRYEVVRKLAAKAFSKNELEVEEKDLNLYV